MGRAGKALRQVLERYRITQNRLAVAMGTRRSNVNRWVYENADPVAEAVLEIRDGLRAINPDAAEEFIQLYLNAPPGEEEKS
ncbi:helix-turn-helix domain-containing protein [Microseira sp. BLCC-F43]|jgi:transcriptional regulator with XRE-family HTH domain|uniref:helix-turn-helix domain-containing protein n=1 Tax=Microseira sp. BLCC-F43 TaxID=3153602 RepID=UPI0035B89F6D